MVVRQRPRRHRKVKRLFSKAQDREVLNVKQVASLPSGRPHSYRVLECPKCGSPLMFELESKLRPALGDLF